jgi:hypothetical protein
MAGGSFIRPYGTGMRHIASRAKLNSIAPTGRAELSPHVAFIVFDLVAVQKF